MKIPKLFRKPEPIISKERAVSIAQYECKKRKLPWLEPVDVHSEWGNWVVFTNSEAKGGNVRIVIKKKTGEVMKVGFIPR